MFNKILIIASALVMAIGFTQANMAKADVVMEGLVSYWTFDEKDMDGKTLKDIVGPNDGTTLGDVKVVPGKVGEAGYFEKADDVFDCGNDPSLTLKDGVTLEFWVKWNGERYSPIATKQDVYRIMIKDSGKVTINLETNAFPWGGWTTGYIIPKNEWHHLAMVYDGNQMMLYVDGELHSPQEPAEGTITTSDENFLIGAYRFPAYCAAPGVDCRALSTAKPPGTLDSKFCMTSSALRPRS